MKVEVIEIRGKFCVRVSDGVRHGILFYFEHKINAVQTAAILKGCEITILCSESGVDTFKKGE